MTDLSDILSTSDVSDSLTVANKKGLFQQLSGVASRRTGISAKAIVAALNERERLGSTGFGGGVAIPPIAKTSQAWRKAVAIAHIALQDLADSRASEAMFFHAKYVRPGWRGLTRVASVGNHIFYR